MKKIKFLTVLSSFAFMTVFAGCESIFEDEKDCSVNYNIRFIYDYNMSGGDGFSSQVTSVSLWVFEHDTGLFTAYFESNGEELSDPGFRLQLENISPGNYDCIAWCGLQDSNFNVPEKVEKITDLTCTLKTEINDGVHISDTLLPPLFYGSLDGMTLPEEPGTYTNTIYLMKDTNNINISLQHISEEPLIADEFIISMELANGSFASDNSLLPSPEITYFPWSTSSGVIDMAGENVNFVKAELSTSRIMSDQNPIISIVEKETGSLIYSIPFVDWTKKLRSASHLSMNDQEYLDREHEYTLMLQLIKESGGWKTVSISINGFELNQD